MALKIALKPNERMIIGGAVITNGGSKTEFMVENDVPILRQKDIMGEKDADSPCRKIYFVVQLMYIDPGNLTTHHQTYWQLVRDVLQAAPSTREYIDRISREILADRYYQALKITKQLIDYEQELMSHVTQPVEGV